MLLRHRICAFLYFIAIFPAWFIAGPGSAYTGHFDWLAFDYIFLGFPTVISVIVLMAAWVVNPRPNIPTV
jgi:hypothetical protein